MKPRMPLNHRVLVVAVAGLLAADFTRGAGDLAKSEAAALEAKKQELAANETYDSHQMAHAATREIARSERVRAEAALKNLRAAEAALKQAVATGKREADLAELRKAVEDRTVTLRAAADRMVSDSLASSKASAEVIAAEQVIRDKMAEVRKIEQDTLEMKARAAEKAKAADADAARRAVLELAAQKALETQQWPNVRKDIVRELVEQTGEAARVARDLAAAETDANRKQKLEQFAGQQAKAKSAAEKLLADTLAEMEAATPRIYPLRMAAMGGLKLLPPEKWDYAKARHLLVRAGFGGTPQEVEKLHKMGLYKAVDHLVEFYRQPAPASALDPVPPTQMDNVEARLTLRFFSSRVAAERQSVERGIITRVRQSWLQRMVESPRPLQEKLALFWHGHFANQSSVVDNGYIMYRQNQFFREHAAANFGGLLYGIVHDPAMIRYLDNNKNVKGDPNENLAREIMELFAMGVDQGYTEKDIIQAARALTGYTYDDHTGGFRYDHAKHDTEPKTIFGKTGNWTGDDVVRLILEQPTTARYISRKLFEYFVFLDPSPETVERLASVLRARNYELDPLLKNLFLSEEFYSERAQATQIKSPVQLVVGTLRDLGVKEVSGYGAIDGAIQQMGQQLFEPPDVKGWRYGRSWISSNRLFVRYNSVADLIKSVPQGRKLGAGVDVVALLEGGGCPTGCDAVDYLAKACLMRPLTEAKRKELTDYLGELPPPGEWTKQRAQLNEKLRGLMVLMLSTPEYQLM